MKAKSSNTYSEATALKYISKDKDIYIYKYEPKVMYVYVDGQKSEDISGYSYAFVQDGVDAFNVKLPKEQKNLYFLDKISLEELEAIEIMGKVYFRAKAIHKVK